MFEKAAANSKVIPAGDFVSNIAVELAKRMIRGSERITLLLDEVKERFPDTTSEQIYAIMSELQMMGFDVTPNDWLYYTPVEYRASALKSLGLFRNAKVHGSRYEDIMEALKEAKAQLKDVQDWLKDNDSCKRLSPSEYYSKYDQVHVVENEIEQLNQALKLSKASVLYDQTYGAGMKPLLPLGIAIEGNVSFICRTADNILVTSPASDLMIKSALDTMNADMDAEPDLPLHAAFEKLAEKESLQPFWSDWKSQFGEIYDSPESISEAINDFLGYIQKSAPLKQMDSKAIDMAYEELDEFIKQTTAKGVQLETKINEFKAPKDEFSEEQKVNIGGQESMSDSPNPEISQSGFVPEGGPVGGNPQQRQCTQWLYRNVCTRHTACV